MNADRDINAVTVADTVDSEVILPEPDNEDVGEELAVSDIVVVAIGEFVAVKIADKDTELIGEVLDEADSETKDE